jgi:hypothetical protein
MFHFSQGGRRASLAAQAQPIGSIVRGIIQDQLGFSLEPPTDDLVR